MAALIKKLEQLNRTIGETIAWLTVFMVLVTVVIVVERHWFQTGSIRLQESLTYMHAAVLLIAAAYTLATEDHVRVDIFYRGFSPRAKAWVNLFGSCLLLAPFCVFLIWYSWDYVAIAWQIRESSQEAGGLPFPFPALLKSFMPVAALLLALQGLVIVVRASMTLLTSGQD